MKVAHESNPNRFQQGPAYRTRKDTPAGIQQGLQSIRLQGSQPRLLLGREREAGKSHEPSGCQETLPNRHPHLEAPAPSASAAESKEGGEMNCRAPTVYLPPPPIPPT